MSRIEIVDRGRSVEKGDVRVNHPLSYGGASIYQASYGSDPVFLFDVGGKKVQLSQGSTYKDGAVTLMATRFERSIHDFGPGVQIAYLDGNKTQTVWFVKAVPALREKQIGGVTVRLDDIVNEFYTGLEGLSRPRRLGRLDRIRSDPLGLYINFFLYYRRILPAPDIRGCARGGNVP